jgi:cytochrome c oxidase assembly protein subunit 15
MDNNVSSSVEVQAPPRWLHRWALLTVCATFVLLLLGAVVTTFRVGMADPIWPTYPWHLLLVSWEEPSPGFLIEHSHRLAGYVVGCCVIVLTVGLWLVEPRRWLRWLGTAALLGVIFQGLLGGFRVKLNALVGTDLATIHGCFAQLVFGLLVSLVVLTSRTWFAPGSGMGVIPAGVRRWSIYVLGLIYVQIVLGAILRHTYTGVAQRGHLLLAFVVVAATIWLLKITLENDTGDTHLTAAALWLAGLVGLQIVLGVESYIRRFAAGVPPELQQLSMGQAVIRTAHVLVGSLVLGASVVVAMRAHRQLATAVRRAPVPARRLEGVV